MGVLTVVINKCKRKYDGTMAPVRQPKEKTEKNRHAITCTSKPNRNAIVACPVILSWQWEIERLKAPISKRKNRAAQSI